MNFEFNVEGGNFTKAGTASSQLKKILKQLNVDSKVIKRIVVALYEAEVNGETPRYAYACGFNCAPGPGYWPMAAPVTWRCARTR